MTLCADDVLYLPVTTEIASLPQLTPDGLPLALARRAAEDRRMANAVAELTGVRLRHTPMTPERVKQAMG